MEVINKTKRIDSTFHISNKNMINSLMNIIMDNIEDDEWKRTSLMQLEGSMKNFTKAGIIVEEMNTFVSDIFKRVVRNDEPFSDYLQKFASKKESLRNSELMEGYYNKDDDLQTLRKVIAQILCKSDDVTVSDEDDDIRATQQDINLIDPISKKLIEDPVRHSKCGHVYERSSIMQMIKQGKKRGAKCPYMGCGYRDPLNPQDFEVALDYRKEIQRRKRLGTYN